MIDVLLIAKASGDSGGFHGRYKFKVLPRAGEQVAIIEDERDVMLRVVSVVHLPTAMGPPDDGADVHVWADLVDGNYQF
jgi:hypothetical protein